MAILSRIDEMFEDPEKITPDTLRPIFHEMLSGFRELKERLGSNDESERNDALDMIAKLREKLEETAYAISGAVGMDPKHFEAYVNNPAHFSPEEWEAMREANSDVADFKRELESIGQNKQENS